MSAYKQIIKSRSEFSLIYSAAEFHCSLIDKKIISELCKFGREFMTSSEDSGLINVWEEICVQTQTEESVNWDAYEDLMMNVIQMIIEREPEPVKDLIGYIASLDISDNLPELDENSWVYDEDVIYSSLLDRIVQMALDYENDRISEFKANYFNTDDDEEDDFQEDDDFEN